MKLNQKNSVFGKVSAESLNRYSHFGPRMDWMKQFFDLRTKFIERNNLGYVMLRFFKKFLQDAELLDHNVFSFTADKVEQLGLGNDVSWAIMMVNLSNNSPLVKWYVRRVVFDENYSRLLLLKLIDNYGAKGSQDIVVALGQISKLPFMRVGFGKSIYNGKNFTSITRIRWKEPPELVILYSLYKFAEVSCWKYGFTLKSLFSNSEDNGVSPVEIFGVDEKIMISILNGLTVNYPEFISASFTLDLNTISLNPLKTSRNVLELLT